LKAAEGDKLEALFILAWYLGIWYLGIGKLLGLRWEDIDIQAGVWRELNDGHAKLQPREADSSPFFLRRRFPPSQYMRE